MRRTVLQLLPLLCAASLWGVVLIGCRNISSPTSPSPNPQPQSSAGKISFQHQVLPIFMQYGCPGCHGGTNGLTVTSVADLLHGGVHGPAIIAGNANGSILVQKISPNPPFWRAYAFRWSLYSRFNDPGNKELDKSGSQE